MITKKPTIAKAEDFIQGAKAEKTALTDKRKSVITDRRKKAVPQQAGPDPEGQPKKKMTVYLTEGQYLKWKSYELGQLKAGNRVSFQGVVEQFLNEITGKG